MLKQLAAFLFVCIAWNSHAQKGCCSKSPSEAFAAWGATKSFVAAHAEPLPFVMPNPSGKDISFKTPDGKQGHAYEVKPDAKKVILLFHEWWGLNDYIKQEADKLSKETGARVLAIDLYDKKVTASRDTAASLMQQVKTPRAEAIIKGALGYVGKEIPIGTIGWCFGGGWSLQAALLAGKQAKACVMYYGMPEENKEKLKTLNAPVFFVGAYRDEWITPELIAKFEKNMKDNGKSITIRSYDTGHAFANPSNPNYSKAFSADAWKNMLTFFKENL